MRDGPRTTATMFRVLPWWYAVMLLCVAGCPSTSSSTDAAADRGLIDATTKDTTPPCEYEWRAALKSAPGSSRVRIPIE